jgi:hypothetical protein
MDRSRTFIGQLHLPQAQRGLPDNDGATPLRGAMG